MEESVGARIEASSAASDAPSATGSGQSTEDTSALPLVPLERVYDGCVGGFLAEKSRFILRISTDGKVHGEVRRRRTQPKHGRPAPGAKGEKYKRQRRADHPDGVLVSHVVGNAQFVPAEEAVLSSEVGSGEYCCAFEVMKRLHHVDRHTLTCHLHVPLVSCGAAVGTWRFFNHELTKWTLPFSTSTSLSSCVSGAEKSMANHDEATIKTLERAPDQHAFQLQPVSQQQRLEEVEAAAQLLPTPALLYPLRPGKYEFRGFTTYDVPTVTGTLPRPRGRPRRRRAPRPRPELTTVKDDCLVTLRLLPDGTLRGSSREVVQPQVCHVHGRWQANRLAYVLEYRVREAVGHFRYSGAVVIESKDKMTRDDAGKTEAMAKPRRRELLSGKWRNVDENHVEGYEGGHGRFELELVRVDYVSVVVKPEIVERPERKATKACADASENQDAVDAATAVETEDVDADDAICALTTGAYTLSGRATDSDGYEYAFELELELHATGSLEGTSRERVFTQSSPVFGQWTASGLTYYQEYVVRREVGMYVYSGQLGDDGAVVRGAWSNAEPQFATSEGEHGTFALLVTRTTRRWSVSSHMYYPRSFRRGVLAVLMASARTHALPVALWTHIFGFFTEDWFSCSSIAAQDGLDGEMASILAL